MYFSVQNINYGNSTHYCTQFIEMDYDSSDVVCFVQKLFRMVWQFAVQQTRQGHRRRFGGHGSSPASAGIDHLLCCFGLV
jgi:hypothetical protein